MTKAIGRVGLTAAVLGIIVGAMGRSEAGTNLVSDGGFESGDYTGWNVTGSGVGLAMDSHSGTWAASFAGVYTFGTITQDLPTTPGASYTLDFFLKQSAGGTTPPYYPSEFQAVFGGAMVLDLVDQPYFNYAEYRAIVTATSTSTTLTFNGYNNIAEYYLDDVSVTAYVPEPASIIPAGVAVVMGLGVARRRSKTRRNA